MIFNRKLVKLRRERAASMTSDFLLDELALNIVERLAFYSDIEVKFALNLGCHHGQLSRILNIDNVVKTDIAYNMLYKNNGLRVVADEEFLPFADESFDAIFSIMTLHNVNDLPGSLVQIRRILKPGGIFIATLLGAETLFELRQAILYAEMDTGISPRVIPFIDIKSAGQLLQRAGFGMPVSDSEIIEFQYRNVSDLFRDLRAIGETNYLTKMRRNFTSKTTMNNIIAEYKKRFTQNDKIITTFEIITITGINMR